MEYDIKAYNSTKKKYQDFIDDIIRRYELLELNVNSTLLDCWEYLSHISWLEQGRFLSKLNENEHTIVHLLGTHKLSLATNDIKMFPTYLGNHGFGELLKKLK